MDRGTAYGIGVGPGDPKLMTLLAVETIARCPVVAAPRTRGGRMVALDIAAGAVDLRDKTILPLDFAMSRDAGRRAASHRAAADLVRPHLDAGRPVAVLNLGDVSIFASFRYLADILREEGYPTEMVAGVPSFCAAAAALGTSLTEMDAALHIIPDGCDLPEDLEGTGTTVWMKSGRNLPQLLERFDRAGIKRRVMLVQNCGMRDERLFHGLNGDAVEAGYFTLAIVKNPSAEEQA